MKKDEMGVTYGMYGGYEKMHAGCLVGKSEGNSYLQKPRHEDTGWEGADWINPYPTAFPYRNGMVLHFYQQQESSTTKTVHKVINKGLKAYV